MPGQIEDLGVPEFVGKVRADHRGFPLVGFRAVGDAAIELVIADEIAVRIRHGNGLVAARVDEIEARCDRATVRDVGVVLRREAPLARLESRLRGTIRDAGQRVDGGVLEVLPAAASLK